MPQIVDDIAKQVDRSVAAGAKILAGGKRIGDRGNYYAPTVLTNVPRNAPAACEETFGPVAAVFRVRDAEEAIAVANETKFGLGASVWTRDRQETMRFIDGIDSGQVFVNAMVASDPRVLVVTVPDPESPDPAARPAEYPARPRPSCPVASAHLWGTEARLCRESGRGR